MPWTYKCDDLKRCVKDRLATGDVVNKKSLGECKLTCDENSMIWPRPRESDLGNLVIPFHPDDIEFTNDDELGVS